MQCLERGAVVTGGPGKADSAEIGGEIDHWLLSRRSFAQ
jgi:hypothetical protein